MAEFKTNSNTLTCIGAEISRPSLNHKICQFGELKFSPSIAGPELLPDSVTSRLIAIDYLRQARSSRLIRITGAGYFESEVECQRVSSIISAGIGYGKQSYEGMVLTGGTRSIGVEGAPKRFGMTEVGALLERSLIGARILGIVPGQTLDETENGVVIHQEGSWKIGLHPGHRLVLAANERTAYKWDAEWHKALEIKRELKPECSLLISFDGGVATDREIRAWAEESRHDNSTHIILVRGGGDNRATNLLARHLGFRNEFKNVHSVSLNAGQINAKLQEIGLLAQQQVGKIRVV